MVGPPSRRNSLLGRGTPLANPSARRTPRPLLRLALVAYRPLERFLRVEAASGVLLLLAAAGALLLANSPWAESYLALWHIPIGVHAGELHFQRSLEWLVNDGLMVIFFFVVGLEIRRELHQGELSEWRRASLPAAAALGGMLAPALLYLSVAAGPTTHHGWGVPMATDIAFAVGILALLGKRVPPALRVLLLALAVIDDLGAIIVIACFYSGGIALQGLVLAAFALGLIALMQRLAIRHKLAYLLPGFLLWLGISLAGVHPTIAGVILGLVTPVHAAPGVEAMSPAQSLIERLHPWVAYGIMPVFALANAGVPLSGVQLDAAALHSMSGIGLGLVLGKPVGVLVASGLCLRLGVGSLPRGLGLRHIVVLGVVAGVGFTMALFVAQLAFMDPQLLAAAKLAVLLASAMAAILALALGRALLPVWTAPAAAHSENEAERD